jgi:hypothetical protein
MSIDGQMLMGGVRALIFHRVSTIAVLCGSNKNRSRASDIQNRVFGPDLLFEKSTRIRPCLSGKLKLFIIPCKFTISLQQTAISRRNKMAVPVTGIVLRSNGRCSHKLYCTRSLVRRNSINNI